jgi:mannose-6-phosphate isomerase-like protein (cupin superfamily)
MADYTLKNLKADVEDSAATFGVSPALEARFAREPLDLEKSGVSYLRLAPGERVPWGHTHKQQEEVYVVVSGSGRLRLDDEEVAVKQWDAIRISADTMRNVEGGPDGVELILIGAPNAGSGDAEIVQGWWGH